MEAFIAIKVQNQDLPANSMEVNSVEIKDQLILYFKKIHALNKLPTIGPQITASMVVLCIQNIHEG